jgi:hypothetical protein
LLRRIKMIDMEELHRICDKYQCEVELENIGTAEKERYMAILKTPRPDQNYSSLSELEKEVRAKWPEICRIVLDITPGRP